MIEQWKAIVGYENFYEVSTFGRVKRIRGGPGAKVGKILKTCSHDTYPSVDLCQNGKTTTFQVHILVLIAFVGPKPTPKHECNHKDGNKWNPCFLNLEWVTHKQNCTHRHDILKKAKGEKHYRSKDCLIVSPCGEIYKVKGLRQFCLKHTLSSSKLSAVARKELRQYKGWTCQYV